MSETNIQGGVHCAEFVNGDQHIHYGFGPEDVERLIEKVLAFMQAGGVFLPAQDQPDILEIEHEGQKLAFRPGAARQLASQGQERSYLLSLAIDREYQRWATRFVPLAGKMDVRQVIEGLPIFFTEFVIPSGDAGPQVQATQKPLKDISEAMQSHGAFVILGEPGAGKTTTLQKIAFDLAQDGLKKRGTRIPLFVRLSQQGERDPYSYLQTEWERRVEVPFKDALRAGKILILADGINEIPREKRNDRLTEWMLFDERYRGTNQLIFSSRETDYSNQLDLPRVLIEPLNEERVQEFLQKHHAEGLADLLNDPASKLDEMARNPLNLFVLVMVYLQGGRNLQVLANRGRLFQSFAMQLLHHEQKWHRDNLSVDVKVELFAQLAYDMQKQGSGTTFDFEIAKHSLPESVMVFGEPESVDPVTFFGFGRGASILDPATLPDVRFYHHSLQEYFAARELLKRFNLGEDLSAFWKTVRIKEEMPPAEVSEWDALPEPPTTGWEVTTILACGLSTAPAKFIEALRQHNPVLAGRCIDEAGIRLDDQYDVRNKVRADLLADLYDPAIHLRARLMAGFVLGHIGDPRFEAHEMNGVKVILPQMVSVPAGKYIIGSKKEDINSFEDEYPQFVVYLSDYSIGRWSVTNAEFECFINSGGYQNKFYWEGELAQRWLNGEDVGGGQIKPWLDVWKMLQSVDNVRATLEESGSFTPDQIDSYEYISKLNGNYSAGIAAKAGV